MIFARKVNYKIPEFYMIFARKCPKLHNNCPKIFFPNLGGGGTCPPVPRLLPLWWREHKQNVTKGTQNTGDLRSFVERVDTHSSLAKRKVGRLRTSSIVNLLLKCWNDYEIWSMLIVADFGQNENSWLSKFPWWATAMEFPMNHTPRSARLHTPATVITVAKCDPVTEKPTFRSTL